MWRMAGRGGGGSMVDVGGAGDGWDCAVVVIDRVWAWAEGKA
jgi:hypothetical protein